MDPTVSDYVILAATLGFAVCGLFMGLSGEIGFLAGAFASVLFGCFAWVPAGAYLPSVSMRGVAVFIAALLVFGIVRWIVKRSTHVIISQPGDAIFGAVMSALAGFAVSLGVVGGLVVGLGVDSARSEILQRFLDLIGR